MDCGVLRGSASQTPVAVLIVLSEINLLCSNASQVFKGPFCQHPSDAESLELWLVSRMLVIERAVVELAN